MTDERDKIGGDLGRIERMLQDVKEADKQIRNAAEHRLGVVNAQIEELRPKAISDEAAGAEYQKLVHERGVLHGVLAPE